MKTPASLRGLTILPFLFFGFSGCASTRQLSSFLPTREIVVDGKAGDWDGKMYLFEGRGLLVGVQNDSSTVWVCVEGLDPSASRAMMRSGVAVWFDPGSGDSARFGVRLAPRWERPAKETTEDELRLFHPTAAGDIEILNSSKKVALKIPTLSSEREYGIKAAIRDSDGTGVFEMKVPRNPKAGQPGVGRTVGGVLGIEIETGKSTERGAGDRSSASGGERRGDMGGEGGGRRGGGMRGGRRGDEAGQGERSEGRGQQESVSISLKVKLATP